MKLLVVSALLPLCANLAPSQPIPSLASQAALVNQYCAGCHNDKLASGGFSFARIDLANPDQNAAQAEKVILKLRTGMMPPAGMPRPNDANTLKSFAAALEDRIDQAAAAQPNPGRPALHRLNRTEYRNSIHDLLSLDVDVESLLPPDDMSHGFDNMAEVLNVSPALMDGYLRAAGKLSRLAVGDPAIQPGTETYHLSQSYSQLRHVEGTPVGTRGGIAVVHNFPADGEYVFKMTLYFTTNTFLFGSTGKGEQLEVALNGRRVALFDVNPLMKVDEDLRTPPVMVKAGPQKLTASFIKKADGPVDDFVQPMERSLGNIYAGQDPGVTALPHLRDISVAGPFHASGVSDPPSRRKIFLCRPAAASDEVPCARKILASLARQAWRAPVSDADLEDLLSAYQRGRNRGDFDGGIRVALELILAHPEFIFRFERTPAGVAPGSNYRISELELASRLAYFLWSTAPDDELISRASEGKLRDQLEQEVRRMRADARADSLGTNFAGQWLYLRNLRDAQPDIYLYPDSDENLLNSMRRETELLFNNIARGSGSVLGLLTANYTFVDERLAKHYGIPGILGSEFRCVTLTDPNRFGLLGQASILTVTSFSNRTSPVVRGKWILEQILGVAAPTPPPNVPPLKDSVEGTSPRSVRARLEEHRTHEPCASCHRIFDPIGMALENFDAVGVWRTHDSGNLVDPDGKLVDGTVIDSPAKLRSALMTYSEAFIRNFTAKLMTYALGRGVDYADLPVIRAINREAAKNDNTFFSIVMGIVKSAPFQMRRAAVVSHTETAGQLVN